MCVYSYMYYTIFTTRITLMSCVELFCGICAALRVTIVNSFTYIRQCDEGSV